METREWLFGERLTFGREDCPVALCTLWTGQLRGSVPPHLFCVMGNLFSHTGYGVAAIARNVLAHPHVRTIVVCGEDRSGGKEGLLRWRVADAVLENEHGALAWLRETVRFVEVPDLDPRDPQPLIKVLEELQEPLPAGVVAVPRQFPAPDACEPLAYPSEQAGMRVCGLGIDELWRKALALVLRFGLDKSSQHGPFRELLCLASLLDGTDNAVPFSAEEGSRYLETGGWLDERPAVPPGLSYTYPHRIRVHFGFDQWEHAVGRLRADPGARFAVVSLWDPRLDATATTAPCLTELQLHLHPGTAGPLLHLRAAFRSHDIGQAYPLNLFALRELQRRTAAREGWRLGSLVVVSSSAHIYDYFLERAREEAESRQPCQWDRRGNINVRRLRSVSTTADEGGGPAAGLAAALHGPGGQWLRDYTGTTPQARPPSLISLPSFPPAQNNRTSWDSCCGTTRCPRPATGPGRRWNWPPCKSGKRAQTDAGGSFVRHGNDCVGSHYNSGQPCSCVYCRRIECSFWVAYVQVSASHGQPCSRAHRKQSR